MWGIELNRDGEAGLSRQIYLALKTGILSGAVAQGEALPSTRELAAELDVSRNTVCAAYDMLWTEGYIENRQGALSRVAEGLTIQPPRKTELSGAETGGKPEFRWDFRTGQPDLLAFPWKPWNGMLKGAAESLTARQFAYSGPKGFAPLCAEIARWLLRARNMQVDPKDVFITSGSTQALYLLSDILRRGGAAFALENPSHPGVRTIVTDKGYPLRWMPVDEHGADVSSLAGTDVSAAYVTPAHQFPLGGILPASRRAALIRLSRERDFYIIEDDYDSEFRYAGSPVSPIYTMDSSRAVYVGTFSKTLFPALRIGFVVLPDALQEAWKHVRNYMDVQNPVLEQAALAEFLRTRRMDKHVRRMRRLYGEKRKALLQALQTAFGDAAIPWGDASGLHLALQFPGRAFDDDFIRRCLDAGVRIAPVSQYCASRIEHTDKLLLGYGHLSAGQIREGIRALKDRISSVPAP
jgi:GntR family transcriptional regulator / MocR family aminotransferase